MAKAKPKAGPKAQPTKADALKRKLDALPDACAALADQLWNVRPGWRDYQRALVLSAITETALAVHVGLSGQIADKLAELHAELDTKTLTVVEDFVEKLEPFEPDTIPDSLHGKLMRQRIEEAVDGVDDDLESFVDYLSDGELCPKASALPPLEALEEALYGVEGEACGPAAASTIAEHINTEYRALDAEEFFRAFVHSLTPQHRCTIAAALAAS